MVRGSLGAVAEVPRAVFDVNLHCDGAAEPRGIARCGTALFHHGLDSCGAMSDPRQLRLHPTKNSTVFSRQPRENLRENFCRLTGIGGRIGHRDRLRRVHVAICRLADTGETSVKWGDTKVEQAGGSGSGCATAP